jgi:hypothetical protein
MIVKIHYTCPECGREWDIEQEHTEEEIKEGITLSLFGVHGPDCTEKPAQNA